MLQIFSWPVRGLWDETARFDTPNPCHPRAALLQDELRVWISGASGALSPSPHCGWGVVLSVWCPVCVTCTAKHFSSWGSPSPIAL